MDCLHVFLFIPDENKIIEFVIGRLVIVEVARANLFQVVRWFYYYMNDPVHQYSHALNVSLIPNSKIKQL